VADKPSEQGGDPRVAFYPHHTADTIHAAAPESPTYRIILTNRIVDPDPHVSDSSAESNTAGELLPDLLAWFLYSWVALLFPPFARPGSLASHIQMPLGQLLQVTNF
jgi:hypothetical protein